MCFKTINYNDVLCGWVGGMQARFDNLLAKASIIQNYHIFSSRAIKVSRGNSFSNEYNSRETQLLNAFST